MSLGCDLTTRVCRIHVVHVRPYLLIGTAVRPDHRVRTVQISSHQSLPAARRDHLGGRDGAAARPPARRSARRRRRRAHRSGAGPNQRHVYRHPRHVYMYPTKFVRMFDVLAFTASPSPGCRRATRLARPPRASSSSVSATSLSIGAFRLRSRCRSAKG